MFDIHRVNFKKVDEYIDGLMDEFAASPEGKAALEAGDDLAGAQWMLHYALNDLGLTPPKMKLRDFNEIVFEIIPRQLSTEAENGPEFIRDIQAFWQFAQRQYGLSNAATILTTLGEQAGKRLQKKLADPANFGMAKSFIMEGVAAGFDMTTKEGIDQFQAVYNERLLNRPLPPRAPLVLDLREDPFWLPADDRTPAQKEQKRKERKRQRQARKRNRR
jgi:hypothetical protein